MRASVIARAAHRAAGPSLRSFVVAGVVVAACTAPQASPLRVSVGPSIVFPRGLLDAAAALSLDVYDATTSGATCDPKTGRPAGLPSGAAKVASQSLRSDGCAAGVKFCGSLSITKSTDSLLFAAVATSATGAVVADGCATATVNQDALDLTIPMVRFVPAATCGNGVIEPTEQCENPAPGDPLCDANCHSKEMVLSTQAASTALASFLLWPAQSGEPGRFFAFFSQDQGAGKIQVAMRILSDALLPVTTPPAASAAILAPNDSGGPFPPVALAGNQSQAAAAFVSNTYWYAFVDDYPNDPDIHLRSFDHALAANQPANAPIGVNGTNGAGEANQQLHPSVAVGPGGKLLIAWQDLNGPNAGQVMARTFDPTAPLPTALGVEQPISTGTGNQEIHLAATPTGWLAVWDDGTTIKMRPIASNGTPEGAEQQVSDSTHSTLQDHPSVAVLPSGAAAIVWCDHTTSRGGEIFVQRYDANLTPVAGDQTKAINDVVSVGDQITPSIAAGPTAGGSFVAVWIDKAGDAVRGRALDATGGFLYNPIDGQPTEFEASIGSGSDRADATVVIGGAGPSVAVGWTDATSVTVRRFPPPAL